MSTKSTFSFKPPTRPRYASRNTRLMRLRSTAEPNRFDTENPTLGPASLASAGPAPWRSKQYRTRYLFATDRPARYTRAKSSDRESRPVDRFTRGLGRETFATLVAPALEHGPARASAHALTEPVHLLAVAFVRLIGPLHVPSILIIG